MLFCLGSGSWRIVTLAVFFFPEWLWQGPKVCVSVCAHVCMYVCVDTSTNLIISNQKSEKFLAFTVFWSFKSHSDNFLFCFGCCFVFHVFIFNHISQFKMTDLPATKTEIVYGCCLRCRWKLPKLLQNVGTRVNPDLVTRISTAAHRLHMCVSLERSNALANHCVNGSPAMSHVCLGREWLMFDVVPSGVCSD